MLKKRMIGTVPIEIDIFEANEVYLESEHAQHIEEPGISGILDALYTINKLPHMPLSVFIELTSYCNFSCPFCYINEDDAPHFSIPRFSEFRNTLDYLINRGMLHCLLSGGECLLHPDFADIYRYLKEEGVLVTVFSNGYLLNDETLELLCKYMPFKIEISLYGFDDRSYQTATNNTRVRSNKIFENILKLKQADIHVVCKTPITSLTETSYDRIEQWCQLHDIPFYSGIELMNTYSGKSRDEYVASECIRERFKKESDFAFWADPQRIAEAYSKREKRIAFDCAAGKTEIMINSNNMLMPCMKAAWIPGWQWNIGTMGIQDAYEQFTRKIIAEKGKPLRYCSGCEHHIVCQECYMTQYEHSDLRTHRVEYCKSLHRYFKDNLEMHGEQ